MAPFLRVVLVSTSLVTVCLSSDSIKGSFSYGRLQARETSYISPPYYPTPPGGWTHDWAAAYGSAYAVVSSMTLAEKVSHLLRADLICCIY